MTEEEPSDEIKKALVIFHNVWNEYQFKHGQIALPKIDSYEALIALNDALSCISKPVTSKFQDIGANKKIVFDIPEKYR